MIIFTLFLIENMSYYFLIFNKDFWININLNFEFLTYYIKLYKKKKNKQRQLLKL